MLSGRFDRRRFLQLSAGAGLMAAFPSLAFGAEGNYEAMLLTCIDPRFPEPTIVNNGHTIQINAEPGNTLKVGKDSYDLLQYHFHHPSEHLIAGKNYPMEVHFVHRDKAGALAVVGALMTAGKPNAAFKQIIVDMPATAGAPVKMKAAADPNAARPKSLSALRSRE